MKRSLQMKFLKREKNEFGGSLFTTRRGRTGSRPLSTRESMHFVLWSSRATGDWSFKRSNNERAIRNILQKFSKKFGVQILSAGNVGNHLHLQLRLSNRYIYKPFIRAITSAIAMAVTGINRWTKIHSGEERPLRFWDRRPYSRVVQSYQAFLNLRDYIKINVLEGHGINRDEGRLIVKAGIYVNSG